ncbi:MAG: DUF4440 domain-containing protein [Acidobacteria bacterium]|nr:DUF4440 domain-containing protein [Acidobacteriota bacterium]
MKLLVGLLAAVVLPAQDGCVPDLAAAPGAGVRKLMELDARFCRDFAERGVEGWMAHWADDVVVFAPDRPVQRTKAEARDHYQKVFGGRKPTLRWNPRGGMISSDGELGFTYGTWRSRVADREGKIVERTGKYQTTWRRQKDGSYKIVADIGQPDAGNR